MAGKVAKLHPFNSGHQNEGFRVDARGQITRNMEERDVLDQLTDSSVNRRADIIEQLRGLARRNGGRLPFLDQQAIFRGLAMALGDADWEVRNQCIQLINELIPHLEGDVDSCMNVVLPRLVPNMGDSKITIRRAVIQTIHVYMQHTYNMQQILHAIVQYGLENQQVHIKKEAIIALPMLFTPEFANENFYEITQSLAKKLIDTTGDKSIQQHALLSLGKIQNLVGDTSFNNYLQKLSPPLRKNYFKLIGKDHPYSVSGAHTSNQLGNIPDFRPGDSVAFTAIDNYTGSSNGHETQIHIPSSRDKYEFGVIPSHIMDNLRDQGNFRVRAQAVEELKMLLKEMSEQQCRYMTPHVNSFIAFLKTLLEDTNFKITTVTLDIIGHLVYKQGHSLKPYLKGLIAVLTKPMSDPKIVIRQAIMKVIMQLMQIFSPKDILTFICDNLSHRNSRVRQETLNIVIASLLTFPSYDFDLSELCQKVAHTLVDPKRQVRQAALECFAAIASNLGAGKLQPLVAAVDGVELSMDGDGVMAAVQARLARRILPKLSMDGLVEYATPVPGSAGSRTGSVNLPPGADIEWILSASGSIGGSARSNRSDMELESVVSSAASSARSTPAPPIGDPQSHGPTPRRFMSAGKGSKNRLPWEDTENTEPQESGNKKSSAQKMTTRQKQLSNSNPNSRDQSPDTGNSYRQMYLKNKEKRSPAQTEVSAQPFSVYNPNRDDDGHVTYSTPRTADYATTWPDDTGKPNKRLLEPIADEDGGPDYSMPTKPALARGTSSRSSSKRKVPPIALGGATGKPASRDAEPDSARDSARDSILDGIIDDDGDDEMYNSIRQIRHSATRKKVDRIFEKLDTNFSKAQGKKSQRSPSPETVYADSGFSSNMSTLRSQHDEVDSAKAAPPPPAPQQPKKKGKKSENPNPFETKPRLARKPSMHKSENPAAAKHSTSSTSIGANNNPFSPHGGVTFKENPNINLQMVGTGYGEDAHPADPKPSQHAAKARDRRRSKGMFDSGGGGGRGEGGSSSTPGVKQSGLGVVQGVRVRQNSENEPNDDDDDQIAISQATRAAMQLKVKARKEEAERMREEQRTKALKAQQERDARRQQVEQDRLRIQRENEERQKQFIEEEERRQKERLRRLSNPSPPDTEDITGLAISGSNSQQQNVSKPKPPASKANGTPAPKRKAKPAADLEKSSHEPEAQEDLKPFKEPASALQEAMKMLSDSTWDIKCQGLNSIRRLALHHQEVLVANMHSLDLALVEEIKNLRSQVSRLAIITVGEMLAIYKKPMEPDLDLITRVLLHKAGEANEFIRQDVDRALNNMVENVNPQRAMLAIINGGADHRNPTVRSTTANFLVPLVFRMGPGRLLSGIKDVTDRILPTAANFLLDGNPDTRHCGMQIVHFLMSHEDFERSLKKFLSPNLLRNIQDKLDSLKKKGLSEPPSEASSARNRRSGMARNGSSVRYNSANSSGNDSTPNSSKRRSGVPRTDEATMDEIKDYCAKMSANDWKERQAGIQAMRDMAVRHPDIVGANITKIFDKFVPCLKDSNSKVNLYALRVIVELCPLLRDYMSNVVTYLISTVAANLSSKNRDIHETATEALDAIMEHLDYNVVLQPFCQQAMSGNARIKPDMIERVSYLACELHQAKPNSKTIKLHVLPVLWALLEKAAPGKGGADPGSVRYSTVHMVQSLYGVLGDELFTAARGTSSVTPRMQSIMEDMLDITLQ